MTSPAEERAEQARWKLRPEFAGFAFFDRLVENEFLPPEQGAAEESRALRAVVGFAAARVPYYRDLFARLGLRAGDIRDRHDLPRLPVLTRQALRDEFERLKPDTLPPGVEVAGTAHSSGSTGPPTQVVQSTASNLMFSCLNQRQSRWFRRDPALTVAVLRNPQSMPQPRPGEYLAPGATLRLPRWLYAGTFFESGPSLYFNVLGPVEGQLEWLRRQRPDYLITRSHSLEHLAMAAAGERPCASLKATTAISEAITPATRRHLESVFGAPVQQGYGLNEIGLVAARCEADRYHVHREHCIVEVIDETGAPCADGRAGRLVVTGLHNFAMPLLRYDSDDLVTALDGPCPCGRTLPSFGEVHGRYSRITMLPPDTVERVDALRCALQAMPSALKSGLRRYQIRQYRDGVFELRFVAATALPPAFGSHLERAWRDACGAAGPPLRLREAGDIPLETARDKFDDFVSEFAAWPDRDGGG
jgi:phenylacetate-CoA ligase